jgi:hypothetical protein
MRVFYYQFQGKTYLVCVPGDSMHSANSPIWRGCNACSWLVPGTAGEGR